MQKMHGLLVNGGGELRIGVKLGLLGAPIVGCLPICGETLEVLRRYASAPTLAGRFVGPSGIGEPLFQIVDLRLGNIDLERRDGHCGCPNGTESVTEKSI